MQAIVAVSQSWGIGRDGQLLFRLSADLRRFKALTTGHTVVMGRRTLQSLPDGKGLPNRRNLVLSRRPDYAPENAEAVTSVEALLRAAGRMLSSSAASRCMSSSCPTVSGSMSPRCWPTRRLTPFFRIWTKTPPGALPPPPTSSPKTAFPFSMLNIAEHKKTGASQLRFFL